MFYLVTWGRGGDASNSHFTDKETEVPAQSHQVGRVGSWQLPPGYWLAVLRGGRKGGGWGRWF